MEPSIHTYMVIMLFPSLVLQNGQSFLFLLISLWHLGYLAIVIVETLGLSIRESGNFPGFLNSRHSVSTLFNSRLSPPCNSEICREEMTDHFVHQREIW
ncbi:unnamed protein product [Meloidogyne enterolobii]|uniref:Uncharacterized protein n=1 Tax=Meloidogyne enterolobii TaxID=390850 RepID=A0ACB0XT85_MELEN